MNDINNIQLWNTRNLADESPAKLQAWSQYAVEVQQRLEARRLELLAEKTAQKVG